ncbi:MAG: sulfotransferase [Sphingomicrobium sp.]
MIVKQGAAALFDRPILLISTPRSGSTLLFETLERAPALFTPGGESHGRIERIPGLFPGERNWDSNRLTQTDATPETIEALSMGFYADARDRAGNSPEGPIRFLEKTPKNALRIPFFDAAWPDAHFVYLYRDPSRALSSMIEAWLAGRFRTYPRLPGWTGPPWSLLLVPGWRELDGKSLPEVVARQWAITTDTILADLDRLPSDRVHVVDHAEFLAAPQVGVDALCAALDLGWDQQLGDTLPLSKTTVSRPSDDKWMANAEVIENVWPIVAAADARARAFLEDRKR